MSVTRFRAPRACAGAKRDFFLWIKFFFRDGSNEVSHAPGWVPEVCFNPQIPRYPGRDPDREETLRKYIYIDNRFYFQVQIPMYILYSTWLCFSEKSLKF